MEARNNVFCKVPLPPVTEPHRNSECYCFDAGNDLEMFEIKSGYIEAEMQSSCPDQEVL